MTRPRAPFTLVLAVLAVLIAGCGQGPASPTNPSAAGVASDRPPTATAVATDPAITAPAVETPKPFARSFGPTYPAAQPAGRATRIDRATLTADRSILTIDFVGGPAYLASNPCSTDYEPWLAPRGDQLDVVVVGIHHPEQAQLGPNMGCTLEGYGYTFHLALPAPFEGTTIKDLGSGGTLLVGPPAGTAVLRAAPPGWKLQAGFQLEPGPPPIWIEVYAAAPVAPVPDEQPGHLVFYQAFGIVGEWTDTRPTKSQDRGGTPTAVTFLGRPATVWVDPVIGELLLGWDIGGRSYGLIGNAADMTIADLVRYAESVTIPG